MSKDYQNNRVLRAFLAKRCAFSAYSEAAHTTSNNEKQQQMLGSTGALDRMEMKCELLKHLPNANVF